METKRKRPKRTRASSEDSDDGGPHKEETTDNPKVSHAYIIVCMDDGILFSVIIII